MEKKVSSRELRRAYKQTAEDLKSFTGAAAGDLTKLNEQLQASRELCADLSQRLDEQATSIQRYQAVLGNFITQDWWSRLRWLVGR